MKIKILIASAIVIIVVGLFIVHSFSEAPRAAFEKFVAKPIPNSVRALEEKHFLAMDSTFWVFRFQIDKSDLQTILTDQHFSSIDENQEFKRWNQKSQTEIEIQKEDYLNSWRQRIQSTAKLDVNFSNSWQIFSRKEGNGTKYLFFNTNSSEAVFVANAH